MAMTSSTVTDLVKDELLPALQLERTKLDDIDRWARWGHDTPHKPKQATPEYKALGEVAQVPWGDLIVGSIAQTLYVEGYRRPSDPEDGSAWRFWQANGMDGRQVAMHRSVLMYGTTYGMVLPGKTLTGEDMPVMRGVSPRQMIAMYDDPAFDEWPVCALRTTRVRGGYELAVYDSECEYKTRVPNLDVDASEWPEWSESVHDAGQCPVVRYTNRLDLEGRATGEIEPFIPLLGSIDQTKFDRLVVQRFSSWVVRTVSGMSQSETVTATGETAAQIKLRMAVEDLLIAEHPDTKFGSLPATPLTGFIEAHDSDLRDLAAVSQTPAFELLGQMANLSAEALEAAKSSQTAKADERKHTLGEHHEQFIRLACHVAGDADAAGDFSSQVRWADTSIRSLSQAADAFGKLIQMAGVPPEVLWPKIPGFSQGDVDEAKAKAAEGGAMSELLLSLADGQQSPSELPAAG